MKKVAVIMGSDSDFPVVSKAVAELKAYGVPYECHVMSAHRTPALASDFADKAKENGFGVIICAAGMAAHLAGVIAGHTTLPVIGIPCKGANFDGMDALLGLAEKLEKAKQDMIDGVVAKDKALQDKLAAL